MFPSIKPGQKMKWLSQIILIVTCVICHSLAQDQGLKQVCYLRGSTLQEGFSFDQITGDIPCTHFIFSYVHLNEKEGIADPTQTDISNILETFKFRNNSKNFFNVMLQIGGDSDGKRYSEMTSQPPRRKRLVDSIVQLVKDHNLDGVDINWRFPGDSVNDKHNYLSFLQELRNHFNRVENRRRPLISLVLPNTKEEIIKGYNLLSMNSVVDFMNVLSFNMISHESPWLNHQAPVSAPPNFSSVENITRLYIRVGATARKLVMGIPLFGRKYTVDLDDNSTVIASDMIPYNKICQMIKDDVGWRKVSYGNNGTFLYHDSDIISYDDEETILNKARLASTLRLGGLMFWSLDMGDWSSSCGDDNTRGSWPLIRAAADILIPSSAYVAPNPSDTDRVSNLDPVLVNTPVPINRNDFTVRPVPSTLINPAYPPAAVTVASLNNPQTPFYTIVESVKDITIDDISIEINENHWPRPANMTK